ncbi:L-arabinose ABC transporter ATP-binding protein AraG [Ralstonia pickettii]|uniref:L-arabinose ABC transporter ATP-binding protein AraG n=1 Tax=Ralstonia pickettii TaxID=329 RepID=UPI0015B7F76A|nr:L-arabinose ABC transporter ATP-binding protein AraG [Ralstonia pickettii]NWK45561.1 L-arabinose ABC transporter ATP-binding protein AraG [Ralstonia pickettii]WKZ84677.1 L-arabinose ABC transporter ATP-binding protein AraG [Ralstonia pickettii]
MSAFLEFRGISKVFPGVRALSDVSFGIECGRVHGLLGENGAGKSTLLKILGGDYQPDGGQIVVEGKPTAFPTTRAALDAGIAVIHQELQTVPELTVMDNLLLGHLPASGGFIRQREAMAWTREQLGRIGVDLDPRAKLKHLSIGQRQMVEICKAILRDARVIALDEPTSSLSIRETDILFRLVKDLRAQGRALIYISHRLDEIFELCDGCTIFRDGRKVADFPSMANVTRDELVAQMVGRQIDDIFDYRARPLGDVRLQVDGLMGPKLAEPASLSVRRGEIVGLFGLVGAGRSELARLIYGADRKTGGSLTLDGAPIRIRDVADAIRQGIVLCPEDRKEEGIIGCRSVSENINISCRRNQRRFGLFVNDRQEAKTADHYITRLRIKTPNREQPIRLLSGGNQQKAILARWLAEDDMRVLIIDEPTRGIDVGAKNEIYQVLYELAERGVAVLMISSELPEILGVADRVLVMSEGRIAGELPREQANEQAVLKLALRPESAPLPSAPQPPLAA